MVPVKITTSVILECRDVVLDKFDIGVGINLNKFEAIISDDQIDAHTNYLGNILANFECFFCNKYPIRDVPLNLCI